VFGKVDTEAQQALAASFGITSIPTLMIIRDKVILYAQPGAISESALEDAFLAELFQGGPNRYPREGRPPAPGLPGDKARNQHDRERSSVSNVFTRVVNAVARVWPLQSLGPLSCRATGSRGRVVY